MMTRAPHRRTGGFTLIELMIALVAGSLVIVSVYSISGSSARLFSAQQHIAQLQMNVRFGMERLRRDIGRAGFGGVADSSVGTTCIAPPAAFQAITFMDTSASSDDALMPGGGVNTVEADRITLVGNFASDVLTSIETLGAGNNVIYPTESTVDLERAYPDNSYIHIQTPEGNHLYTQVTGRVGTTGIQVNPPLPAAGCGGIQGGWMAPLRQVEYRVDNDQETLFGLSAGDAAALVNLGQSHTTLVRVEQALGDPSGDPPLAGTLAEIVLDDVAEIDYEFMVENVAAGPGILFTTLSGPGVDVPLSNALLAGNVRSVRITLAGHTRVSDPDFRFVARPANSPLTHFWPHVRTPGASPELGASQVRELRAEVFTPNLAP